MGLGTAAKFSLTRLLPPVAWAGIIFALSATPGTQRFWPPLFYCSDKLAHLIAYAALGFLVYRAGKDGWLRSAWRSWLLAACVLAALYGATDELHQLFVPARSCTWGDWLFDAMGSVLGVAVCALHYRRPPSPGAVARGIPRE